MIVFQGKWFSMGGQFRNELLLDRSDGPNCLAVTFTLSSGNQLNTWTCAFSSYLPFWEGRVCAAKLIVNENISTSSVPLGVCKVKPCFFIWSRLFPHAVEKMPKNLNGNQHLLLIDTVAIYFFIFLFGSLFDLGHIQRCKPLRLQDKLDKSRYVCSKRLNSSSVQRSLLF